MQNVPVSPFKLRKPTWSAYCSPGTVHIAVETNRRPTPVKLDKFVEKPPLHLQFNNKINMKNITPKKENVFHIWTEYSRFPPKLKSGGMIP